MNMRVLTPVERILSDYCASEAQGILLAKVVTLPKNPSEEEIENAVMLALVKVKQAASGTVPKLELISGFRRDLLREEENK